MIHVIVTSEQNGLSPFNLYVYQQLFNEQVACDKDHFPSEMSIDEIKVYRVIHFYLADKMVPPEISGLFDMLSPFALDFVARSLSEREYLVIRTNSDRVVRAFWRANSRIRVHLRSEKTQYCQEPKEDLEGDR